MCKWGITVTLGVRIAEHLSHTGESRWKDAEIDECIAPLVFALQREGIDMTASCCGHGKAPGRISLVDGRELIIVDAETKEQAPESKLWRVTETENPALVHVTPNFGRPHALEGECWCQPTVTQYAVPLVVHHEPY